MKKKIIWLANKSGNAFPQQKLTPEDRIKLFDRHLTGESYQSLAAKYGISYSRCRAICSQLRRFGNA